MQARVEESLAGRPRVETPGVEAGRIGGDPDGPTFTREVLRLPDGRVLRHGVERTFHPGGRERSRRSFERDRPSGEWLAWYPDGTLRSSYVHSDEPAPMTFHHPNGRVSATGLAVQGVRCHAWRFFDARGRLVQVGEYEAGLPHGAWTRYGEDGEVLDELHYEHGEPVRQRWKTAGRRFEAM